MKKRRFQQVLTPQEDPPEVIFDPSKPFSLEQERKRSVFFDQLEEMVEKCSFPCPPGMAPYLKDPEKQRVRIPNDLDPARFTGNVFFIDYMNIFPAFQRALLSKERPRLDADVWKDTSYYQKIENLSVAAYRIALLYYCFSLKGYDRVPPTANDWVFIVSQGSRRCGRLTYEESGFLNGCHILLIEVPCADNLNYYPLFITRDCHLLYDKNEVDDYFLVYCLLYFQSFRDRLEQAVMSGETASPLLWSQKLVLISNDQYSWATPTKNRVEKLPTPWPSSFTLGFSNGSKKTTGKPRNRR